MTEAFQLCQAIAAELSAQSWDPPITATAVWTVSYEPRDLAAGPNVRVIPDHVQQLELLARDRGVRRQLACSLLVQQKVADFDEATLAPLAGLQTALDDYLRRLRAPLTGGGLEFWYQPRTVAGFVRRHLEQYRVYTGFLDLTYILLKP